MTTSYQPGDRVFTNVNGVEVEASVVRLSIDVEVKTPDGKLWWRALSKVRPVANADSAPSETAASHEVQSTPAEPSTEANLGSQSGDISSPTPASDTPVVPSDNETAQAAPQMFTESNTTPCGAPEEMTNRKRRKGSKGRR